MASRRPDNGTPRRRKAGPITLPNIGFNSFMTRPHNCADCAGYEAFDEEASGDRRAYSDLLVPVEIPPHLRQTADNSSTDDPTSREKEAAANTSLAGAPALHNITVVARSSTCRQEQGSALTLGTHRCGNDPSGV